MDAPPQPDALHTLANAVTAGVSSIMSPATATATPSYQTAPSLPHNSNGVSAMFASLGRSVLLLFSIIPGLLFWLITFATITLPTWLFTLFSMSLTFTMNFTTL
jgi:lysophospholipid hydrolase